MNELIDPLAAPIELPGGSRDGIVLLHGWTGSPAHLRPLATSLNEAGHTVVGPLLTGHGTSLLDLEHVTWRSWIQDAAAAAHCIESRGLRLHVVGLSMGGLAGLVASTLFPTVTVTTINSPQLVRERLAPLARVGHRFRRFYHWDVQPPPVPELSRYWVQYTGAPVRSAAELMGLIRASRKALPQVRANALVIQSRHDETVKPISGIHLYSKLGSQRKRLLWLEKSRHVATLDTELDTIVSSLLDHMNRDGKSDR